MQIFQKMLRDGESNPGLPRDRRGYSPLYYRGTEWEQTVCINILNVHGQQWLEQLCLISGKFVNVHECSYMFEIIFKAIRILNQSEINESES